MKTLIVGTKKTKTDAIPYAQIYPFFDCRDQLRKQLGLIIHHIEASTLDEILAASEIDADIYFVRPSWREHPDDVEQMIRKFRERRAEALIFFIDPFDQTTSRFFSVLPYVDKLLKYQALKDVNQYRQQLIGGTVLTDTLSRQYGYDLKDWHVGSDVPAGYEHRIESGWYISLTPKMKKVLLKQPMMWEQWSQRLLKQPLQRDIDIFCHVSYGARQNVEWYGQHRIEAIKAINRLAPDHRLSVSGDFIGEKKVSSRQYRADIKRSRIAVSPFGWGELTFRDYEAVAYGCLLVKPCIDHVDAAPDIFVSGETYVPVQWDFADLEEKCRYYLSHPEDMARIVNNARQVYVDYFEKNKFVQRIQQLIRPRVEKTAKQVLTV